ncbi:MAG TPA: fatty acid desaturase family protein [Acidimicrobiales bacterium]|jgi:fatty acid desaturase|nr:fatty acid desaturase family protein [Acidimicrobiales bacterium]
MTATMVPDLAVRPSVLPTDRLLANGMARPDLRQDLRRINDVRNTLSVIGLWAWVAAMIGVAVWVNNPFLYLAVFILMGPIHARFAILMHEAAHKLLFSNKRINDWVGTWVIAYPALVPIQIYRRGHFAHHKHEFGPEEPDMAYYGGYRCDTRTLARRLVRDAVGISGWKNLVPLLKSVKVKAYRKISVPILGMQVGLWAVSWVAAGRWWIYPAFWLAPWMTQWRVINRLRAIAEHGGMEAGDDRRVTTHNVRQSWLARFWIVPYNTGWHLAHHVDMGIPFRNLPKFYAELERAGYVTPGITYPNYIALWKDLASA